MVPIDAFMFSNINRTKNHRDINASEQFMGRGGEKNESFYSLNTYKIYGALSMKMYLNIIFLLIILGRV